MSILHKQFYREINRAMESIIVKHLLALNILQIRKIECRARKYEFKIMKHLSLYKKLESSLTIYYRAQKDEKLARACGVPKVVVRA